ncbi:uncharacterized protein METZ01_LOCUS271530 [marine metagenome]|uniref:Uncharacterized protein n=1 Tax=marine metagenome TaxID=408172 RepID=A0A382K3T2_9ZZZZ
MAFADSFCTKPYASNCAVRFDGFKGVF